jgi:hypothetical protein
MIQGEQSHGEEGRLAPADRMAFNASGGKPPFLTMSYSISIFSLRLCASAAN